MATIQMRQAARTGKVRYTATVRLPEGSISKTFPNRREAQRWAESKASALREGRATIGNKHATVKDAIEEYRKHKPIAKDRDALCDWWIEKIGHVKLRDLRRPAILTIRNELRDAKRSASTINHYISVLHSALAHAVANGWIAQNVASDAGQTQEAMKLRMSPPKGRIRFLNDDERKALLDACQASDEPVLYPLVLAALSTGCRAGELLALEWNDVDLEEGRATIQKSKNGEARAVPLGGPVIPILQQMQEAKEPTDGPDYVFRSRSGTGGRSFNYRRPWGEALKAAKIKDFRFHDLRHTAASYLAQAGVSLYHVGHVLGHKTPHMTARYAHLTNDGITAARDILAARLNGKQQGEGDNASEKT